MLQLKLIIDGIDKLNVIEQDFLDINSECTKNDGFEEIDDLIMENNKIGSICSNL